MISKKRAIVLPNYGDREKLGRATKSSRPTVWRALNFQGDSLRLQKIRYVALNEFGGQLVEYENNQKE